MKRFLTLAALSLAMSLGGCSDNSSSDGGHDASVDSDGLDDGGGDSAPDGNTDGTTDGDGSIDLDGGLDGDGSVDSDDGADGGGDEGLWLDISLQSSISHVQPMTGIVLWNDHSDSATSSIQLEYSYMPFDQVAVAQNPDQWDWSGVESLLNDIAGHGHQAILRFYYVYPGQQTTVPAFIKNMSDYHESSGNSEGELTYFPDWSHAGLQNFTREFYTQLAARYDHDPRLAFIQVGFGLWGEYHIYDPGEQLGVNFPSFAFQAEFFRHLETVFTSLRWSISIDAADSSNTPFDSDTSLLDIAFGLFDDSFLHAEHGDYNAECFDFFGAARRLHSPVGGELSYYTNYDQQHALDLPDGPHGISYEALAAQYNVSYMIGNDQPDYQPLSRLQSAGIASGYAFEITAFSANELSSRVTVRNGGIAPIYYPAFVTVNGVRAAQSLDQLMPGQSQEYTVASGGQNPILSIECDRLVAGQEIQFQAEL